MLKEEISFKYKNSAQISYYSQNSNSFPSAAPLGTEHIRLFISLLYKESDGWNEIGNLTILVTNLRNEAEAV